MTMETGDGEDAAIPQRLRSAFFDAEFTIMSFMPTFQVDISILGLQRQPVPNFGIRLEALDARTAHRITKILAQVKSVPLRRFLQHSTGSSVGSAQELAPISALAEVLRAALSAGAAVHLPKDCSSPEECLCCYFDLLCDLVSPSMASFRALLRLVEVLPSIFSIEVASDCVLGSTFLRLQEYYESPNACFRRCAFAAEDYKTWCRSDEGRGKFDYYLRWRGFNLPSWVLADARGGKLGPLRAQEEALLQVLSTVSADRFYVIGSGLGQSNTLRHEIAHGLYFTSAGYRVAADRILSEKLSPEEHDALRTTLLGMGYCDDEEILTDEMQAYLSSGDDLGSGRLDVMAALDANFDTYSGLRSA